MSEETRLVMACDLCEQPFTDPREAVRLRNIGTNKWLVIGYGSGPASAVVHAACLQTRGTHQGNIGEQPE